MNSAKPKIVLSGYFGFANTGDEALLAAVVRGIGERLPGASFTALSGTPEQTAREHGIEAFHWRDDSALMRAIDAADYLVLTGGLFHDFHGVASDLLLSSRHSGMALHAGAAIYAALRGCSVLLVGCGFGPIASEQAKRLAGAACEAAALMTVRDQASADWVASLGVEHCQVTGDPVFAYPPDAGIPGFDRTALGSGPVLGVSLRAWEHQVDAGFWERQTANALDAWLEHTGGSVVFIPMQTGTGADDDRLVAERVAAGMKAADRAHQVQTVLTPGETRGTFGACDLVMGMRYHALAFAALNNTPFLALSYDDKVRSLAKQTGMSRWDIPVGDLEGGDLARTLNALSAECCPVSRLLRKSVPPLRQGAMESFEAITRTPARSGRLGTTAGPLLAGAFRTQARLSAGNQARIDELEKQALELSSWSTHLNDLYTKGLAEIAQVRTTLAGAEERAASASGQVRYYEAESLRLAEALSHQEAASDALRSEANQLRDSIVRTDEERVRGTELLGRTQARLDAAQTELDRNQAELGRTRAELSGTQTDLQRVTDELLEARSRLSSTDAMLAASEAQRIELDRRICEVVANLAEQQRVISMAEGRLSLARFEASRLQAASELTEERWRKERRARRRALRSNERQAMELEQRASRIAELQASMSLAAATAQQERERLQAWTSAQQERIEELAGWSKRQASHVEELTQQLEQSTAAERNMRQRALEFESRLPEVKFHRWLDRFQASTPEWLRRLGRPVYMMLYRRLYPGGKPASGERFQPAAAPMMPPAGEVQPIPAPAPAPPDTAEHAPVTEVIAVQMPAAAASRFISQPLISVVLPVWNHKGLLRGSIQSVLEQTWRNLELIVVDDGSENDLLPVLDEFRGDPRLRAIRRPHEGLPRTLSAGFRVAKGEFRTWTSADNLMHPDMLESLAGFLLRRPDVDMTYADMDLIDGDGHPLLHSVYRISAQRSGATNELSLPSTVETLDLVNDNFIGACFLYRAWIANALGDYDDSLLGTEDYDYWLRLQTIGTMCHLDSARCLYSYRVHDDSLSGRHEGRIGKNAELLIERNRVRKERVSHAFSIDVITDESDHASESIVTQQLAGEWRKAGHDVHFGSSTATSGRAGKDRIRVAIALGREAVGGLNYDVILGRHDLAFCGVDLTAGTASVESAGTLARKARDNRYGLWDVPEVREPLFVYLGPLTEELDTAWLTEAVNACPDAMFLVLSGQAPESDPFRVMPKAKYANVLYLGQKRPAEWPAYLSRARALLAPFAASALSPAARETLVTYLNAAKPIVASAALAGSEFRLMPNTAFVSAADVPAALDAATRAEPDARSADGYLATITVEARAARVLRLVKARLMQPAPAARPGRAESVPRPQLLLETETLDRGGLEQVVFDMAREFNRRGYPVSIAVTKSLGAIASKCRTEGIPVVLADNPRKLERAVLDADILIPHFSTEGVSTAWKHGIPVLGFVHNSYIWAEEALERQIRDADRQIRRYVAVSASARNYFCRRFGVAPEKVETIPNGIDTGECRRRLSEPAEVTRSTLGLSAGDFVFLMTGSLIGTKAQVHAIAALGSIRERVPDAKLVIVGAAFDTAYAAEIHATIRNLRLADRVFVLPQTDRIFDYYRLSNAFLMTSLTEGWSLAMTEAMYCGLPLLMTAVGGAAEVIEKDDIGILIPPAFTDPLDIKAANLWTYCASPSPCNLHAIAQAMETMAASPEEWKKRGAGGRAKVEARYDCARIAARLEAVIDATLHEHYGETLVRERVAVAAAAVGD